MRHEYLLIRRLATVLRERMTTQGHLAQKVTQEGRGNCLPPRDGCHAACVEARELIALTEPFLAPAEKAPRKPLRLVVLKRPPRRTVKPTQAPLFGEAV